ncbi:MAG: CoA-binding protein [Ardenticatenales bacterium]|nr:CoA-binding protein [Ardenticatenales bacterium]
MNDLIEEFVNQRVWAVVGVSTDTRKFGNIIFRDMRGAGYEVYGVHPSGESVAGESIYRSLSELPIRPDVVDVVVPPPVTEQVVRECHELGLGRVWIQPGAASDAAIRYCQENDIKVIAGGPCAMVHKRRWT